MRRDAKSTTRHRVGVSASRKTVGPAAAMRQGEAVPLGLLAHHQFDRIGNELQTLVAAPVVVHERVVDQRQQGGVRVEIEILLTVPAGGGLADGSQRPAILVAQVVEARVLLVQPFHRDVAAGAPAVGALGRLLHRFDQLRFGIDEPDQPSRFLRGGSGDRRGRAGAQEIGEAFEAPLPRLLQRDESR